MADQDALDGRSTNPFLPFPSAAMTCVRIYLHLIFSNSCSKALLLLVIKKTLWSSSMHSLIPDEQHEYQQVAL